MGERPIDRRRILESVASAAAVGLAGCTGGGGDTTAGAGGSNATATGTGDDASATLRFGGWGDAAEEQSVTSGLSMFEEEYEDIAVNYQNFPYDGYHQKIQTQISAQQAPDVFYLDQKYVGSFAASDLLVNQAEEFDQEFIDGFNNSVLNQYRALDGGLYMMPFAMSPEAVGYNKEVLTQVGYEEFPNTWEEFRTALEAIKSETDVTYPLLQEGQGSSVARIWYSWVYANGGLVMNEDNTECVVGRDPPVEALQFFRELREADLIGTFQEIPSTTGEAALVNNEAAMITGGGTIMANMKENFSDFYDQLGIARPPRPSDGKFGNVIAGAGYSISRNTENREASLNLVKYMLREGITPYLERGIALPVRPADEYDVDIFTDDPRYQTMLEMTNDPRLGNQQWGPSTFTVVNTLTSQLQGVMHGEVAPRDALETVEEQVNSEIDG